MDNNHEEYEAAEVLPVADASAEPVPGKTSPLKKLWLPAVAVLVVLGVLTGLLFGMLTNNYKTPLRQLMSFMNTKDETDMVEKNIKLLNGCSEKEFRELLKVLKKSEDFEEDLEDLDLYSAMLEYYEDEYGDDYKFSYKIEEKEKIDEDDLKDAKVSFKNAASMLKKVLDETEDYESEDWKAMADELGISRSDAKKIVKSMEDIYDIWKNVEATEGYEMIVTLTVRSSDLDEPEEEEMTLCVYKVNGRWVSDVSLTFVTSFLFAL